MPIVNNLIMKSAESITKYIGPIRWTWGNVTSMVQMRDTSGLSFQLPRAPREKGGSNLEATCKDLRFLRDSIINTTTKKYITMQQTHSSSPHRLHEEESTDRRRRRSGRWTGDCCLQPSKPKTVYTHLTHRTRRSVRHIRHTSSGKEQPSN